MDSSKVQQILNWPQPKNIKALQLFLGFANFYRCFIKDYFKKISALTSLLKQDSPFIFNEEALKTDASEYALGAVHPIAFDSRKLLPDELNYEIHDKELLGIVWALKRWRVFLLSLSDSFEVLTDHCSLWLATLPDALSRLDDVYPESGVDFISKNPQNFHQVLKQN
ncbi:hypothetical protein O181_126672 [Austropuccinia psidii MF-1]|uniref:Reverse transcriptase RNase H-like domain-containing protein n=1 Tax=Austropuccinia psidii MF-1 TaxID=1389203 RepID=A0A9Q3Q8Q1_9BASI|nr:hypothetical protein [Austropuccinia psidii MF-1]